MATHRAASSAFLILGGLCAAVAAIGAVAAIKTSMGWVPVLIPLVAMLFAFVWLGSFRLTIGSENLTYRSLFTSERTIPRARILSVRPAAQTGPFESPLTAIVSADSQEDIRVNTKVFPREAVQELMSLGK